MVSRRGLSSTTRTCGSRLAPCQVAIRRAATRSQPLLHLAVGRQEPVLIRAGRPRRSAGQAAQAAWSRFWEDWLSDRSAQSGTVAEAVDKAQTKGNAESNVVIQHRRVQRSFADGLIAEQIEAIYGKPWMRQIDEPRSTMKRCSIWSRMPGQALRTKSKTRGRPATPAEGRAAGSVVEAHAQLELPGVGSGSARQSGVSRVHADRRRRQGSRRQDHGPAGDGNWGRK